MPARFLLFCLFSSLLPPSSFLFPPSSLLAPSSSFLRNFSSPYFLLFNFLLFSPPYSPIFPFFFFFFSISPFSCHLLPLLALCYAGSLAKATLLVKLSSTTSTFSLNGFCMENFYQKFNNLYHNAISYTLDSHVSLLDRSKFCQ